jgi:hypothetical protein
MSSLISFHSRPPDLSPRPETKKADAAEHPRMLNHVGLLFNGPSGASGLPFI